MGIRMIRTTSQQLRVRIAFAVLNTRLLIRIAIVAASVSALSIPVAMAGQKLAFMLYAVGPLVIGTLLIVNAICTIRGTAPVTRAWLTAFVAVVGDEDAAMILARAMPWASSTQILSRRHVLDMAEVIRAERQQAAQEIGGLRSDQIAAFLAGIAR